MKDVRSQDLEALLDYMYLGEVNVNQHDLASLLKTAECLRIKGLAVPDEDVSSKPSSNAKAINSQQKHPSEDSLLHSPPPKRRRNISSSEKGSGSRPSAKYADSPPHSRSSTPPPTSNTSSTMPRLSSEKTPSTSVTNLTSTPNNKSSLRQDSSLINDSNSGSNSNKKNLPSDSPVPLVKVEVDDPEEQSDSYIPDNEYESSSQKEDDAREYNVAKSEATSPSYSAGNFSNQQQMVSCDFIYLNLILK